LKKRTTKNGTSFIFYFGTCFFNKQVGNISNTSYRLLPVTTKRDVFVATYQFKWYTSAGPADIDLASTAWTVDEAGTVWFSSSWTA
jgi:hypothetical protein